MLDLTHVGAFLAGASAVLSSFVALWLARRHANAECEKRLEAFRRGLHEFESEPPP